MIKRINIKPKVLTLGVLVVAFLTFACTSENKKNEVQTNDHDPFFEKVVKINKVLNHKKVDFIDSVLNSRQNSARTMLLVSTLNDCNSCVDKGFKSLLQFAGMPGRPLTMHVKLKPDIKELIIDSKVFEWAEISGLLAEFENLVTRYPTPMLISYDKKEGIKEVYCIPTFTDENKRNSFLARQN